MIPAEARGLRPGRTEEGLDRAGREVRLVARGQGPQAAVRGDVRRGLQPGAALRGHLRLPRPEEQTEGEAASPVRGRAHGLHHETMRRAMPPTARR